MLFIFAGKEKSLVNIRGFYLQNFPGFLNVHEMKWIILNYETRQSLRSKGSLNLNLLIKSLK